MNSLSKRDVVFSGVQPTGDLHIGNYFGAVKRFVPLQDDADCYFCVVDLHSLTIKHSPEQLKKQTLEIAAAYLASGIDPSKASIFAQSSVPTHAEISWVMSCIARMGWMERMHQFKDKSGDNKERASVGLFTYPILMAADILAYGSTMVPVGEDQKQHIELAKDIAQKFNNDFGGNLVIPRALMGETAKIMSLKRGDQKMSKSDPDPSSRINLSDSNDVIVKKIKKATSDTLPFPVSLDGFDHPEVLNLLTIYKACTNATNAEIEQEFGGNGYGAFKMKLAEALVEEISPVRERMAQFLSDQGELISILRNGRDNAARQTQKIRKTVYDSMGLIDLGD